MTSFNFFFLLNKFKKKLNLALNINFSYSISGKIKYEIEKKLLYISFNSLIFFSYC